MQQEIWFQKYQILKLLGRGSTAKVYLALHIKLNSYRVIKFISKNHPNYNLQHKEALILKNLQHSCIPIIYDIEEDEEGSYIVEQYLEGFTLKEYVVSKGRIREDAIIRYGIQLCDLIHYLHSTNRPVLYVDLKPDNIILSEGTLKLIDFGSAIYLDELSSHPDYVGTRGYAAPELYRRNTIDERCDVYGIGMLLYFIVTGKQIRKDVTEIDNIDLTDGCSKQLKSIINRCLKFNPSQRYATVQKLSTHLSAILQKNRFQEKTDQTIKVAIAGTQRRIGVTHFAFRLSNYIIGKNLRCLYSEMNDSGCIRLMKQRYEDLPINGEIIEFEGIPMQAYPPDNQRGDWNYRIQIQDFGCLTKENLTEFLHAEVKLLILGAKDWELEHSENVLNLIAEYKEIAYLFNFINGKQFQQVMKSMCHRNSYRIPYEPDPFGAITTKNGEELFSELLSQINKRSS